MKTLDAAIFMFNTGGFFDAKRLNELTGVEYQLAGDIVSNIKRSNKYQTEVDVKHHILSVEVVGITDNKGRLYKKSATPPKPKITYNTALSMFKSSMVAS